MAGSSRGSGSWMTAPAGCPSSTFGTNSSKKDEALSLFVVLLQMFAETTWQGRRFNKRDDPPSVPTARRDGRPAVQSIGTSSPVMNRTPRTSSRVSCASLVRNRSTPAAAAQVR